MTMGLPIRFNNTASTNQQNLLEQVALNAAAASRTVTLNLRGRANKLLVWAFLTRSAATDLSLTFRGSADGVHLAPPQMRTSVAGGGNTLVDVPPDTKTVSGNDEMYVEYDVRGLESVELVVAGTSGGGSDLVNIQAVGVVED